MPSSRRRTARTDRSRRPASHQRPPCSRPPPVLPDAPARAPRRARSCRRSGGTGCPRLIQRARPHPRCWHRKSPVRRIPRERHRAVPAAFPLSWPTAMSLPRTSRESAVTLVPPRSAFRPRRPRSCRLAGRARGWPGPCAVARPVVSEQDFKSLSCLLPARTLDTSGKNTRN
jgi:hypothetical protein